MRSSNVGNMTRAGLSSMIYMTNASAFLRRIHWVPTGTAFSWPARNSTEGRGACTSAGSRSPLLPPRPYCCRRQPPPTRRSATGYSRQHPAASGGAGRHALSDAVDRAGAGRRRHQFATLGKTLTERFGIGIQNGYNWIGRKDASTLVGWQNLLAYVKYEAILDPEHDSCSPSTLRTNSVAPEPAVSARPRTVLPWCQRRSLPKGSAICRSLFPPARLPRFRYLSTVVRGAAAR
jgi:hypothetical protein